MPASDFGAMIVRPMPISSMCSRSPAARNHGAPHQVEIATGANRVERVAEVRLMRVTVSSFDVVMVLHIEDRPMANPGGGARALYHAKGSRLAGSYYFRHFLANLLPTVGRTLIIR